MKRIIFIILAVFACAAALLFYYLLPNNNMVPAFFEGRMNLVIGDEEVVHRDQPRVVDGQVLLPMDIVKKYFDPNIYWDSKLKKITITTRDKVLRMKTDSLEAYINNKPVNLEMPVSVVSSTVYIPMAPLEELYGIEIEYLKENNVIVIDFKNSIRQVAEPVDNSAVARKGRSRHYPVVWKYTLDNGGHENGRLMVFKEYDGWYKVRTAGGALGYVEKHLVAVRMEPIKLAENHSNSQKAVWKPDKGKINLVWEMMYSKRADISEMDKINGLDVLSPTWFEVSDTGGNVINRSDSAYMEWAGKNGYKVWPLLSNGFDPALTSAVLNNTDARDNLIRKILAYASIYKFDGINIDFEELYKADKQALVQFMREITPLLKEQGLTVSIDINMASYYDRKALGEIADYVMLMAYDQHWRTSPTAGSVAQITWVENNLKTLLKSVPPEKLLLGLPFYTRLWESRPDGNGGTKLASKALSMKRAGEIIKENRAKVVWEEESGQFYAGYEKDGVEYKIWLEDRNSINLKSSLVHKYRLAGTAAWSKSYEVPEIWDVLHDNLKQTGNYQQWEAKNAGRKYMYNF